MADEQPDPRAVLAALGLTGAAAVAPVSGGWDTTIWRVDLGGATYALRLFRAAQAATSRREALAMRAAAAAGLPVPRIHAAGAWAGRPALLLEWRRGVPLLTALQARPARVLTLGAAFGRMQAAIHAVAPPAGLSQGRSDWIAAAGSEEAALQARLRALPLRPEVLLHLDYHPLNVMVDDGRVSGVLDWANAAAGDPRADLARTLTILRLSPGERGLAALLDRFGRRLLELSWRWGYARTAGPSGDLTLFYVWAGLLMARDLAPKVGRPGIPLMPADLDRIRRWTAAQKRRAGLDE